MEARGLILLLIMMIISINIAVAINTDNYVTSFGGSEVNSTRYNGRTHIAYLGHDNYSSSSYYGSIGFFETDTTAPNVTTISPTAYNNPQYVTFHINTSELAFCEFDVDSEGRASMTTSDNRTFKDYKSLSGKTHTVIFYCRDIYGNLGDTGLISFELADVTLGGSGGSYIQQININRLEIYTNQEFIYSDRENIIYVKVYDSGNNLVNAEKIMVDSSISLVSKDITRMSDGFYKVVLQFKGVGDVIIKATAEQNGKIITGEKTFTIRDLTVGEKLIEKIKEELPKADNFLRENILLVSFIGGTIVILLVILAIVKRLNAIKKKDL